MRDSEPLAGHLPAHLPWSLIHHPLRVSLRTVQGLSARVAAPEGVRERSEESCPCPVPPRSPETPPAFSSAVGPYLSSPIPAASAEFAPEPESPAVSRTWGFLPHSAGFGDNPPPPTPGVSVRGWLLFQMPFRAQASGASSSPRGS